VDCSACYFLDALLLWLDFDCRWLAKYRWVKLITGDLTAELGFNFPAAITWDKALGGPLLDGLRRKPYHIAQRGLTTRKTNSFCNSGFHVPALVVVYNRRLQ